MCKKVEKMEKKYSQISSSDGLFGQFYELYLMKGHFFHVIWDSELIFGHFNSLRGQNLAKMSKNLKKLKNKIQNFSFFAHFGPFG